MLPSDIETFIDIRANDWRDAAQRAVDRVVTTDRIERLTGVAVVQALKEALGACWLFSSIVPHPVFATLLAAAEAVADGFVNIEIERRRRDARQLRRLILRNFGRSLNEQKTLLVKEMITFGQSEYAAALRGERDYLPDRLHMLKNVIMAHTFRYELIDWSFSTWRFDENKLERSLYTTLLAELYRFVSDLRGYVICARQHQVLADLLYWEPQIGIVNSVYLGNQRGQQSSASLDSAAAGFLPQGDGYGLPYWVIIGAAYHWHTNRMPWVAQVTYHSNPLTTSATYSITIHRPGSHSPNFQIDPDAHSPLDDHLPNRPNRSYPSKGRRYKEALPANNKATYEGSRKRFIKHFSVKTRQRTVASRRRLLAVAEAHPNPTWEQINPGAGSTGSGATSQREQETYVVVRGDSLWKIAKRKYGDGRKWRRIYAANRELIGSNPNLIHPGQQLVIPAESG